MPEQDKFNCQSVDTYHQECHLGTHLYVDTHTREELIGMHGDDITKQLEGLSAIYDFVIISQSLFLIILKLSDSKSSFSIYGNGIEQVDHTTRVGTINVMEVFVDGRGFYGTSFRLYLTGKYLD